MERPLVPIGQFATWTGLSPKALRLYAESGLLCPARTDPDTGYRYYRLDQVERARMIRLLRAADMPLAEIQSFLDDPSVAGLDAHETALERRQAERTQVLKYLRCIVDYGKTASQHDVQIKQVPAQPYVSRSATVAVADVETFITSTFAALKERATPAGPPFALYHGAIHHEAHGEIEACVPVAASERFTESDAELPAGLVAYTHIQGQRSFLPLVFTAFDAVADWARQQGHELAGPPRKIYLHDVDTGQNPAMEVAWPLR
jgi:DNA-binding transcriptional MerR regulator